jgi:transketolase
MTASRTNSPVSFPAPVDALAVDTLRFLAVDAVQQANSGHPGLPLGAAPMAYTLYSRHLRFDPCEPDWDDRDRFVLSAGHGSALLYSLLHVFGYALTLDDLKKFRQWESLTPGHPERGLTPGVELTTGPLGQGLASAVGMAAAEAHLAAVYNRPGHDVVDHYTYVLCGDGDLMEGVAAEAASLAGHLGLGKLIVLYDDNRITLSASTQLNFTEDVAMRFRSYGWHTLRVEDGNDLESIDRAIEEAKAEKDRPSLLRIHTHIGFGSPNKHDSFEAHGSPLGVDEVKLTKEHLGWPAEPAFFIPAEVPCHVAEAVERAKGGHADWQRRMKSYRTAFPELARELDDRLDGKLPEGWDKDFPVFPADAKGVATRVTSGKILNLIATRVPSLFGGSADLNPSTNTELKGLGNFEHPARNAGDTQGAVPGAWDFTGRNLHFGVREHAMGAMMNGLAAHGGFHAFGATFETFCDYLRPSIRLAAIMHLPVLYIFTHDSIGVGEDGATHEPVEQTTSLRLIPNMQVIRPADANETVEAYRAAFATTNRPTALILSRQNVPVLDRTKYAPAAGLHHGAYVLADLPAAAPVRKGAPSVVLVATGSEVALAAAAADKLTASGVAVRLVSMPSWEIFEAQSAEYKASVLPASLPVRLCIEAGVTMGWQKYAGDKGGVMGVDEYGASAPGPVVMREYGFTPECVVERVEALLK